MPTLSAGVPTCGRILDFLSPCDHISKQHARVIDGGRLCSVGLREDRRIVVVDGKKLLHILVGAQFVGIDRALADLSCKGIQAIFRLESTAQIITRNGDGELALSVLRVVGLCAFRKVGSKQLRIGHIVVVFEHPSKLILNDGSTIVHLLDKGLQAILEGCSTRVLESRHLNQPVNEMVVNIALRRLENLHHALRKPGHGRGKTQLLRVVGVTQQKVTNDSVVINSHFSFLP